MGEDATLFCNQTETSPSGSNALGPVCVLDEPLLFGQFECIGHGYTACPTLLLSTWAVCALCLSLFPHYTEEIN